MGEFIVTTREDIDKFIIKRQGEKKLGENVQTVNHPNWEQALAESSAKFVLFGIPENIGCRSNDKFLSTETFWLTFLHTFLNLEDTATLKSESILVLGAFDFNRLMLKAKEVPKDGLKELIEYVDNVVHPFIAKIVNLGKVPIVIGGGYSNSYPLLKGTSEARKTPVNCISLSTRSDFDAMSGRSAENGFRYAHRQGYLKKYAVVGLHENHNSQEVMDELMDDPDLCFSLYEDIFIREKLSFYEAVNFAIARTGRPVALQMDMSCIESTELLTGISGIEARKFVNWCTKEINPIYFYLMGASGVSSDGHRSRAKTDLAACLIADFIRAFKKK